MHIGYITPEYPHSKFNSNIGGIGTFTKLIAEALVKKGHAVSIFIYSQYKDDVFEENDVNIYHIKFSKIIGLTWLSNRIYFNKRVNDIVKTNLIDVIEAPEWTGFTAGMNFKCPLVIRLHGSDTFFCDIDKRKVKQKNKFFEKLALKGADRIVGVSHFVINKTKKLFNLKFSIDVIYNGVEINKFIPNHTNLEEESLLYFGSIIRKKGVLELAKAFNEVVEIKPNSKLFFLGRDVKDVYRDISTLQLVKEILSPKALKNFNYLGVKPYNEVQDFIKSKEVIVLPSFAEAFPMSWLEAMALEKKMVTSNIGWANELMIDELTGFTVNPNEINELVNSILNSFELSSNDMAVNGRNRIKDYFSFEFLVQKNIKFYKSILGDYSITR